MDSGFPVTRQYNLSVRVYPIVSARVVQLNALFLDERGMIIPVTVTTPVTVAGTMTESEIQCIDGYLLSITVSDFLGTARNGDVYCQAFIKIGQVDSDNPLAMLVRGYVSENSPIYWPGGKDRSALTSPGRFRQYLGTAPGAGNEYSETLEAYKAYNIIGVSAILTTSVAVANRYVYIGLDTDSGVVHRCYQGVAIVAAQVVKILWSSLFNDRFAVGTFGINSSLQWTNPFQGPLKGFTIGVSNIDAGDTLTSISITLEEFAELEGF